MLKALCDGNHLQSTKYTATMDVTTDIKAEPAATAAPLSDKTDNVAAVDVYIDPVMERTIMRKFDWLVMPQFVIIILLVRFVLKCWCGKVINPTPQAYLDRSNIGTADSCLLSHIMLTLCRKCPHFRLRGRLGFEGQRIRKCQCPCNTQPSMSEN